MREKVTYNNLFAIITCSSCIWLEREGEGKKKMYMLKKEQATLSSSPNSNFQLPLYMKNYPDTT